MMRDSIKTVGDIRKMIEGLDDDFKLEIRIMKEVPEEELKQRRYPYPWDMEDGYMEFHDISYSEKELCVGIYETTSN